MAYAWLCPEDGINTSTYCEKLQHPVIIIIPTILGQITLVLLA